jgi:hypothetical protein
MQINGVDEGPGNYHKEWSKIEWDNNGEVWPPKKSFKITKNDKPSVCPKCSVNFEEKITWSDKFCVIRKKCLKCGITDSEIIRKEANSV